MKTLNTRFYTNNTIYNLRSVFYTLEMNNLTIRKLWILNLIHIIFLILFKTFEVYLFTILNLKNE